MLKYKVEINDHVRAGTFHTRTYRRVSLSKARRIVEKAARRGARLYWGEIVRNNWGSRGGFFPYEYRNATITLDT